MTYVKPRLPSSYAAKSRVFGSISAHSLNHAVDRREIL
jgi:hypothetical protein